MEIKNKKIIIGLIIISVIGLFLPWFYFDKEVNYTNGIMWITSPFLGVSIISSIVLILVKNRNEIVNLFNFLSLLLIPCSCIYLFFTWHILTITGEIDIIVSVHTAHCGFYITTISSLIAFFIYLPSLKGYNSIK